MLQDFIYFVVGEELTGLILVGAIFTLMCIIAFVVPDLLKRNEKGGDA